MYNYNFIISASLLALLLSCSGNFEEIPYSSRTGAGTSSSSIAISSIYEASSSSSELSSSSSIA
ncbi:MAG: hypothetical protein FWF63_09470, partial [Fibromonadales bacterium]|nr:hypothetical protein [Fibromonadales bacterium]